MRNQLVKLVAFGLLLSACSGGDTESSSTTSLATTSTGPSTTILTTSTTEPQPALSLLNGLPVEDEDLLDRRLLAVKIDNHPLARPQSGIDDADMVIELMVEGITRFLTFWHESDVDYLGPNRSGRPTDGALLAAFNEPTFTLSGGQAWVQNLITSYDVNLIKELSAGTFRISGRRAPHNLYVNTFELRETADEREYPDNPPEGPIWEFGPLGAGAQAVTEVDINFSGNHVVWVWDEATGTWLRNVGGSPSNWRDQDGTEGQIGVPVMIALYVEQYTVSPPSGTSGSALPSSRTIGSGTAYVFANGKVVEGQWAREEATDWFTLTDANGRTMNVPPGKSWVSLVPSHTGLAITNSS
jgi:hypothetical protein